MQIQNMIEDDYHDPLTQEVPVLARPPHSLSVKQLFQIMIGSLPERRICQQKPTGVHYSSVFVVDLSCVSCLDDLRADDNGVWVHGGKPQRKYLVEIDDDDVVVDAKLIKEGSDSDDENVFTLVRLYHRHKTTPEFQRRISYVLDSSSQLIKYAVIQYLFEDGVEVPVTLPPHGNAKRQTTPYHRTQKSTLSKLKHSTGKPKSVVAAVHNEAGGSLNAKSASELPRDRRQVYNARQFGGETESHGSSGRPDSFYDLVRQCKEDNLPGGRKFIRSINIDHSPSCVLALDSQLSDLRRFCTDRAGFCVLGIDPTFNLGKFYVTITTYSYVHLINKVTNISPSFIGPIFVHTEKNYEAYYHFFATLVKLEPSLSKVCAIGTDGEQAIAKAAACVFSDDLIHLRCFIHMKDNIRRKLTEMLIPEYTRNQIIRDIFGSQHGTVYTKGLLDATSESDFRHRLSLLKSKWDEIERSVHLHCDPCFYNWLVRNEVEVMKSSMIASVRQNAGLGCPPSQYNTNRNESMNRVVQQYCNADGIHSTWAQLSDKLYSLVVSQQKEVEKAIYGMGEYKFKENYGHLTVESAQWFKMTPEQRKAIISKAFKENCIAYESQYEQPSTSESFSTTVCLSVPPDKCGITCLPADFVLSLWKKAEDLLNSFNGVCDAPGMTSAKCVASETAGRPHIVTRNTQKGLLQCDGDCLGWKSQRICSHVLAAAESMGCLSEFLKGYKGSKTHPNLTAAVTHGLSKGVGKKPGHPKRKGPATSRRLDIEAVINPLTPATETVTSDTASTIHNLLPSSVTSGNFTSTNNGTQQVLSSNQILHLNVNPSPAVTSAQLISPTHTQSVVGNSGPFQLKFLTPLIKVCAGCRGAYSQAADGKSPPPPPMDLILVRKEQHFYFNNVMGRQQLSALSNVHYHANLSCPRQRCPSFDPNQIEVPDDVKEKLQPTHWLFLVQTFGLTLSICTNTLVY